MILLVDGIMAPKDVHTLIPRTYEYVTLCAKRTLLIKIKDLKMGRVYWIIQVGPIESHKSSKAESSF